MRTINNDKMSYLTHLYSYQVNSASETKSYTNCRNCVLILRLHLAQGCYGLPRPHGGSVTAALLLGWIQGAHKVSKHNTNSVTHLVLCSYPSVKSFTTYATSHKTGKWGRRGGYRCYAIYNPLGTYWQINSTIFQLILRPSIGPSWMS